MDVARVKPNPSGQIDSTVRKRGEAIAPTIGGHKLSGDHSRSSSYPADVAHQAQITEGIGGWG